MVLITTQKVELALLFDHNHSYPAEEAVTCTHGDTDLPIKLLEKVFVRCSMSNPSTSEVPTHTRLAVSSGYEDLPTVRNTLPFVLPPFQLRSTRYVRFDNTAWELWSPNSMHKPFYPGLVDSSNTFVNKNGYLYALLQRTDGHAGRFDSTVNLQHYDFQKPWSPFVQCAAAPNQYPEFTLFLDYWDYRTSKLQQDFLARLYARMKTLHETIASYEPKCTALGIHWTHRPQGPAILDVARIAQLTAVEEVIDQYSCLVAGIKQLSAWCKFVQLYIDCPPTEAMALSPVGPGAEDLMG